MKPEEEEKITQWIDGKLADDQIHGLLASYPELAELKKSALETGKVLRQGLPVEENLPYPDFFNHRIRQRLEEDSAESTQSTVSLGEEARFLPWFTRTRLFAGLAFSAMAIGLVVYSVLDSNPIGFSEHTEIVGTYTPNPEVLASSHYDQQAEATIIRLDGLEEIPADLEIGGIFPRSYLPDAALAATTLRSKETNEPLLILENDHDGRPHIRATSL